jgi:6-phosphogluconolactonase
LAQFTSRIPLGAINATTGVLATVVGSPFTTGGTGGNIACTVHPSGGFLFVANELSNDTSVFSIHSGTGVLTAVAGSPFSGGAGGLVYGITVSPDGLYLYRPNFADNSVSVQSLMKARSR